MPELFEVLKKVRDIEIRTRRFVNESFVGQYHSVFRGRGVDFDQVREYVPGDEVRTIDWNVTARAGRPYVKQFTEERELNILLLVDVSASGEFGSIRESKREVAAEVASVLAFSAIRNSDKVGAILFSDRIEKHVPSGKGRRHVLRVIREVLACEPKGSGTDIAAALEFANRVTRRRAITFVVSDFQTTGDPIEVTDTLRRAMTKTATRHDLIAVCVTDRHERELPNVGLITLEDAETGELIELNTSRRKIREAYQSHALERRERLAELLRRARVDAVEVETGQPYMPALVELFRTRKRRLR